MLNRNTTLLLPRMEKPVSPGFHFPPGFRFHPSDEELIVHYLHNKVTSRPLPALVIADIDLYKFDPWELPKKALFGEDEWFFFSPRDRKYPNGARPNRAAASGYWKATGIDKPILVLGGSKNIGVKKSLVFYAGRPPKGTKTDWIMNEYRLPETTTKPSRLKGSMRLDDWVLCRVRLKGSATKYASDNQDIENSDVLRHLQKTAACRYVPERSTHVVDHLYKDYQLMASLLAGQAIPATDTVSTISFQGSNNSPNLQNSAYDSSPNTVTSTAKTPKRLLAEEVRTEESLIKRQHQDSSDGDDLLSMVLAESGLDQYNTGQYQGIFDLPASDSIINFHDFNDLVFSDRVFGLDQDKLQNRS